MTIGRAIIVHQNVYRKIQGADLFQYLLTTGFSCQITPDSEGFVGRAVISVKDNVCALGSQGFSDYRSGASVASRHEGGFAFQLQLHVYILPYSLSSKYSDGDGTRLFYLPG